MKEDKKKKILHEDEDRTPSSPVCYVASQEFRSGFTGEVGKENVSVQGSRVYTLPYNPEQIPLIFAEAWMNRDAVHLASLFDSTAEFVNVVGLWWHTRADIEKAHAYGLNIIFGESELTVVRTKVRYLTDEIAVVHAKMMLTGQTSPVSDNITGTRYMIFIFVVQHTGEFWNCISAQNTEIIPNSETFVAGSKDDLHPVNYRKKK